MALDVSSLNSKESRKYNARTVRTPFAAKASKNLLANTNITAIGYFDSFGSGTNSGFCINRNKKVKMIREGNQVIHIVCEKVSIIPDK